MRCGSPVRMPKPPAGAAVTLGAWVRMPRAAKESVLATPNYSYEKRQRELAKKRKNEEKRQRKLNRPEGQAGEPGDAPGPQDTESAAGDTTPPPEGQA